MITKVRSDGFSGESGNSITAVVGIRGSLVGDRYRLEDQIGNGGMGRVWRGTDELLGRPVAVKEVFMPPELPDSKRDVLVRRAMREARAAAKLNHRGIVSVYDAVERDGVPWIVMEYLPGRSLQAELDDVGRLPWRDVAGIGGQIAAALAAAHAAGVVHRDLKPDNVMMHLGRAVVTDFGVARDLDETTRLTSTGMVMGTPQYAAPEQLEGEPVGAPADLWALGATLFAALEGKLPFAGSTLTAYVAAVLTKEPLVPEFAGPLAEMLSQLLRKDPEQRPSAADAAKVLRELAAGKVAPAEPAPRDVPRRGGAPSFTPVPAPARPAAFSGPRPAVSGGPGAAVSRRRVLPVPGPAPVPPVSGPDQVFPGPSVSSVSPASSASRDAVSGPAGSRPVLSERARPRRRWRRWLLWGAVLALLALALIGAGIYFAEATSGSGFL